MMRSSIAQIAAALLLAAAPSLVSSPVVRISLLLPCFGAGLLLALRRSGPEYPIDPPIHERLKVQGEALSSLTGRLNDVMQQTERAILDINERFMSIAGRLRTQPANSAENNRHSHSVLEQGVTLGAAGSDLRTAGTGSERKEMKDETAALTRDIHAVIAALQFEDIVRQQIADVVMELQRVRKEQAEMERSLDPSGGPAS